MKSLSIIAYVLGYSVALSAAEVDFVVSMTALPGKAQAASEFWAKQMAAFRATNPPGQTGLFAFMDGNKVITVEQYVNEQAAYNWAINKTHVDGCLPILGLVDILSTTILTNANSGTQNAMMSALHGPTN
ncbi:hypothetical protein BGW36DRAFT_353237 [Talaromyces proteolyticus]|uniref:ABM domain-containing protein n=1 Tax=Talaromyces proteolyticus TaxID=1131652 RepID=A0AAD4Q0S1_9EURO|nr:uncharacterized protein BGW36DRAFT_353237 [Talaromyces proteolyticus]KAH8704785.1 hypothetical protein BGW36DRAFT_353237 [Talaromyces proteolyticus]